MTAKYRIVKTATVRELGEKVNQLLYWLWEPIGGVVVAENCFMQTMVVASGDEEAHNHRLRCRREEA